VPGRRGLKLRSPGTKKATAPVSGHHIPPACLLAEASSVESQEPSPKDPLAKAALKLTSDASLQLAARDGVSGASTSLAVVTTSAG
jgi:hypothetical protein